MQRGSIGPMKTYKGRIEMIPELNDFKWYNKSIKLNIDRVSLINLVGCLELILSHPGLPDRVRASSMNMGKAFALTLLNDGLILPDEVRKSWEKAFNIPYEVDPDLIIPGLTNQEGRPWK